MTEAIITIFFFVFFTPKITVHSLRLMRWTKQLCLLLLLQGPRASQMVQCGGVRHLFLRTAICFLFDDITNENCVVQNPTEPSENTSNNVGAKGLWFPGKITDGAGGRWWGRWEKLAHHQPADGGGFRIKMFIIGFSVISAPSTRRDCSSVTLSNWWWLFNSQCNITSVNKENTVVYFGILDLRLVQDSKKS